MTVWGFRPGDPCGQARSRSSRVRLDFALPQSTRTGYVVREMATAVLGSGKRSSVRWGGDHSIWKIGTGEDLVDQQFLGGGHGVAYGVGRDVQFVPSVGDASVGLQALLSFACSCTRTRYEIGSSVGRSLPERWTYLSTTGLLIPESPRKGEGSSHLRS